MRAQGTWRLFVTAVCVAGCIEHNLVPCEDQLCPIGLVCVPGGCVTPSAADACATLAEGEACLADGRTGYCAGGACRDPRCGNGVQEVGEACEDNNQIFGDGCSGDCRSDETCGNGVLDLHVGEECDDGNLDDADTCRGACMLPRCGDQVVDTANGEACDDGTANSLEPGAACRPNCQPGRCGDNVVDPFEVCDHGNLASNDGCSGDCLSTEVCGNGYLDSVKGEHCEDDNPAGMSGDGCASTCKLEFQTWTDVSTRSPPARDEFAGALGPNGRVVVFGGSDRVTFDVLADTWEWNGVTWLDRTLGVKPPARSDALVAYDSARKRLVLFGGFPRNDTWEWDGVRWEDRTPAQSPAARGDAAMAYDAARQRVVMFGGKFSVSAIAETWEWDGATWTQMADGPVTTWGHSLAYAPNVGIVLMGGTPSGGTYTRDAQGAWSAQVTTNPGNVFRLYAAMSYNPTRDRILAVDAGQAWELAGTVWSQVTLTPPLPTGRGALAHDPTSGKMLYLTGDATVYAIDVGAGTVTPITPLQAPVGGKNETAYDSRRGVTVLYDGDETWEWDGIAWTRRASATLAPGANPSLRMDSALAYDEARGVTVMFGGRPRTGTTLHADHWEWNGSAWTQRTVTGTLPPARATHGMVYDRARSVVVMVGGLAGGSARHNDTWEWNGTMWSSKPGPAKLNSFGIAYDENRGRTVVFGGVDGDTFAVTNRTFEWDGTSWSLAASGAPDVRQEPAMAYDPRSRRVILTGGHRGGEHYDDTLYWTGSEWKPVDPLPRPPRRTVHSLASDRFGTLISFGGTLTSVAQQTTWRLHWRGNATAETCQAAEDDFDMDTLAGCADPDCWPRCQPLCPPGTACDPEAARCGDDVCQPVEDAVICPADC